MKALLKYLGNYKKESILGPLFKLLEASFELMVPLVMTSIIDIGIVNADTNYILKRCMILIILGLVGFICSVTAQYFSAKAAVGFGTELRNDLYAHINKLSFSDIDSVGTSTLITRITNDVNQVQTGVNMVLRLFLRSPFIVFGAMIMAFTIDVKGAITFVVTIPLLSIVVFGVMIGTIPMYKKVQAKLDEVTLGVREILSGARVVRAFNRQEDEIEVFNTRSAELKNLQEKVGDISALLNPITYIIINVALVVIVWVGGKQVNIGNLTQGEVVALVNYMSQILVELVKLASLIILITKSLACANRITDVFNIKPSIVDGNNEGDVDTDISVEFKNVKFAYNNASGNSIEGINFSVKKGETIGIIGGTGSGKSTLVNLIPRYYEVSDGSIIVNGVDVQEYKMEALRDKIGVVPQKSVLFKGTIRDNLKWGKNDATDEEIKRALEISQSLEIVNNKEGNLDYMINQGGKNLSGGQKQRLTIARALVKSPDILIMDDSSSALDFATDSRLRQAIKNETKDMTVFIVSQRSTTIKYADKIIVLDDGKMVGCGTHSELYNNCQVYREICLSQLSDEEAK